PAAPLPGELERGGLPLLQGSAVLPSAARRLPVHGPADRPEERDRQSDQGPPGTAPGSPRCRRQQASARYRNHQLIMNKAKRYEIFSRLRDDNPHPTTELNYSTPFELLIAVILSAQATDVGVNKATDKLFPVANTPES